MSDSTAAHSEMMIVTCGSRSLMIVKKERVGR
jgi:hypothetical protein